MDSSDLIFELQARADERRNSIDARHQHLFGRLALILGKSEEWIEDCAIADERWHLIEDFFKPGGNRIVMWFYQVPAAASVSPTGEGQSSGKLSANQRALNRCF